MTQGGAVTWMLPARPREPAFDFSGIRGVTVREVGSSSRTVTYVDTEDLRLTRWGCSLARQDGAWLLTLSDGAGPQLIDREMRFAATGRDVPGEVVDLLTALTRGAPLRSVLRARVDELTSTIAVRGARSAALVRDSRVAAFSGRRLAGRFHDVRFSPQADGASITRVVDAVTDALRSAGAKAAAGQPLVRRALGEPAAHDPDVAVADATRHDSARDAMQRAIAASVLRLLMHDAAVRIGNDPEGVHQARVATRRLRSDLRTFKPLLDSAWTQRLRDDLHGLADLLGAVRDTDVLLGRLSEAAGQLPEADQPAAQAALSSLTADRVAARAALLAAMRSAGYTALLDELVDAAAHPRSLAEADGHAGELLPALAQKPWRRLQSRVRQLGTEPPDAELHEVRILAKRARYAAEAVAPVSRGSVAKFARAVAAVQDELGEHHDATVAEAWLRQAAARGSEAIVMGELIAFERAVQERTRAGWPPLWKAAVRAQPKSWA